ncbi:hypothetical protein D3C78_1738810 [compost metagenome]
MRSWMTMMVPSVRQGITRTPSVRYAIFQMLGSSRVCGGTRFSMWAPARTALTAADTIATDHTKR